MGRRTKYPDELMRRGMRLALESNRPIAHIARDLGIGEEALRKRVRRAEVDIGLREGLTTDEREELGRLRREMGLSRSFVRSSSRARNSFPARRPFGVLVKNRNCLGCWRLSSPRAMSR